MTATAGVTSWNARTGAVVPVSGDYTVGEVTGAAPLSSPTFTGTPSAPTAAVSTNTTQLATTAFVVGQAGTATPLMDGIGATGTSLLYARQDHVHPTDTTRAPINSPAFTGTPSGPSYTFTGSGSGSSQWGAAAAAGTPNAVNVPTATANADDVLASDGGSPQQTSWSPRAKVYACGTTTTCSATLQSNPQVVQGIVTLSGGTATVSSLPTFTSTTSFRCTASDNSSIVTGANAVPASATSITVTGTGSDVVSFICAGN